MENEQKINRFALVVLEGKRQRLVKRSVYAGCPFCHETAGLDNWSVEEWGRKPLNYYAPYSYHAICPSCGRKSLVFHLHFFNETHKRTW